MGGGYSLPKDVHVLIVGGGFAGAELALQLLSASANFTLIDPKDVFHQNCASVRSFAVKEWAEKTLIPYAPTFGARHKKGKVTNVNTAKKTISLESGDTIAYDILVISTGSMGSFPLKVGYMDKLETIEKSNTLIKQVTAAETVTVVGGGSCGVEVAGEIATAFPEKQITIIHSSQILCSPEPTPRFQTRLREILAELGVNVIYDEKVTNLNEIETNKVGKWTVKTSNGTETKTDLVINCTGSWVNTDAFKTSLEAAMEDNGALRVNQYLQVEGNTDVFAIGDCNNVQEPKMAVLAGNQGKYLMAQLHNIYNSTPLVPYKKNDKAHTMVLTLGQNQGLGQLQNGYMLPEFVIKYMRSDIFVSKFWKDFKQPMPQ